MSLQYSLLSLDDDGGILIELEFIRITPLCEPERRMTERDIKAAIVANAYRTPNRAHTR